MKNKREHIKYLYNKYLRQTATSTEFEQLFDHLKNPENLEILKQEMSRIWQSGNHEDELSPLYWEEIEMEVQKRKVQERKHRLRQNRWYWWAAAASVLLIIGLFVSIYMDSGPEEYITYRTEYSEVNKIVLDDGSQVTLNANSMLKWKANWKAEGKRVAILEGEAYFDVESIRSPDGRKTGFDVQTSDMTIQVVGTAFNVKNRIEKTDVYLNAGKIKLDLKETNQKPIKEKQEVDIVMNAGESVSYSSQTQKLERADNDRYGNASWMSGTFLYSNESVEDILKSLEAIYGVTFLINDQELLHRKLTTALPYSNWAIVESALELLLRARFERHDNTIMIIKSE